MNKMVTMNMINYDDSETVEFEHYCINYVP